MNRKSEKGHSAHRNFCTAYNRQSPKTRINLKFFELDNSRGGPGNIRGKDHRGNSLLVDWQFRTDTHKQELDQGAKQRFGGGSPLLPPSSSCSTTQCSDVGYGPVEIPGAQEEMNVSRHRRSYHGDFVGSSPCQVQVPPSPQALPVMAFQPPHPPSSSSAINTTHSSVSPLSDAPPSYMVDNNQDEDGDEEEARQYGGMVDMMRDCNGIAYSDSSTFECNQSDEQQVGDQVGSVADGASSYIDGRFRAYGQQSWHQPVIDEIEAHLFPHHHPQQLQQQQQHQSPPSGFVAPSQMSSSGSAYGSYDNRMSTMMATHSGPMQPPPPQPVPFYNQMGAPSANSNYFMGSQMLRPPSTTSLRLRPPPHMNHFDAMAELNDRRAYSMTAASTIPSSSPSSSSSSGGHLSIMASNMNPPDHLLHIYPSNLSNR